MSTFTTGPIGLSRLAAFGVAGAFVAVAALSGLTSCGSSHESGTPAITGQTYAIRGEVVSVPEANNPASELRIRHEAVPGFVTITGDTVTMEPMTMPFTPAKDVSLESIRPGDRVEFVLNVDWASNRIRITKLAPLPGDTRLDFEAEPAPGDSIR